jgi:hypothetical protein
MEADADSMNRARRIALYKALLAALVILVAVLVTPAAAPLRSAAALVGAWLLFASLIGYAALRRNLPIPAFRRPIPIRFTGSLGTFTLRVFGGGRRVEVRAGDDVVAEAAATKERDELVVDLEAVDDADLDALGSAIGAAMQLVIAAEADRTPERRGAVVRKSGEVRLRTTTGGVLRTIGSRSH